MTRTLRNAAAVAVFGTACVLGLPLVALYGIVKYTEGCIDWGKKLINKLDKYNDHAK